MRKTRWAVLAIVVLALSGVVGIRAQNTIDLASEAYFVELSGSVEAFRGQARDAGIVHSERQVFSRLWRGVSVNTTGEGAAQLRRLASVRAVYPVITIDLAPVEQINPELAFAVAMTGADLAQASGFSGTGVKVGVIDSGIDYHHPDLGGGFGAGARVATGYDFVGDRYDAAGSGGALIPHPDGNPDDCNGHGTHVAGIVGASGAVGGSGARGVAPGVTFGAYRVFGCEGSTSADIMLAAMERAYADGMQIVNMSIGAAFQTWPQYPTAVAADALVAAGVVVVTSAGNSGASGVYSASAPGVGRNVIATASFDNSHLELPYFTAAPDGRRFSYIEADAAAAPTSGTVPLTRTGTTTSATDACTVSPLPAGSLAGKVALIRRGGCTFYEKSRNAEVAGAIAVVLYNNAAGYLSPTVAPPAGSPVITIPVVAILQGDGAVLSGRIATPLTGTVDMTWTDQTAIFPNPTGGTISSFSAYGLNAELGLKPNIGAPGGLIRSTVPLEQGGYAVISGTSMASPHVAGAAALYLEAHPNATPAGIKAAFQNTADPAPVFGTSVPDAVHRQGAGMLDVDDAIAATTVIMPSELSLGEGTSATPHVRDLEVTNNGAAAVTYSFFNAQAAGTRGSTFAPILTTANVATASFSPPSLTLGPGASGTVRVTITPPPTNAAINLSVYTGYVAVSGGGALYTVPYAGFLGDYQQIVVLAPGGCSFPGIFKLGGQTDCGAGVTLPDFTRQANAATFNVEDRNDRPVLLFHLAHQSRRLEIQAVDEVSGVIYPVASADYLSRNASNTASFAAGGFAAFQWDGKQEFVNPTGRVRHRALPDGLYRLRVVVTKALAEAGNAAHVETWTSNVMNIVRH